ncbi:MAG: DUF481 domain-containing protein [Acidobacteria bacterium]|nr:DUF481 domain-containing protein [Acidobacteriota bacterium]
MKTHALLLAMVSCTCIQPQPAASQTPAAPPAQAPAASPPPPVWSGKGELSFVSTGGNTETRTFATAAELDYKPGAWSAASKFAFLSASVDDRRSARNVAAVIRLARQLSPRLEGYGQFGYARDRFAGILSRFAEDAGVAYAAIATDRHTLKLRAGAGYVNENRLVGDDRSFASGAVEGGYRVKLSETAEFAEEPGLVLNLEKSSDWRFANLISLTAAVNTIFSVKLSNRISYLNAPVPGFEKTDVITSAALVAKF